MTITLGPQGLVDVTQYGILPGVDSTAAWQILIPALPRGARCQLPAGQIITSQTLDWSSQSRITLLGAGNAMQDETQGTYWQANIAGPIIKRDVAARPCSAHIEGLTFFNPNASGSCVELEYVNGMTMRDIVFQGNKGLVVGATQTTNTWLLVDHCYFNGNLTLWPNSVGCAIRGNGVVRNCYATGCGEALRLSNEINVETFHAEVCNTGINWGVDPNGNVLGNSGSCIGASFEACYQQALNIHSGGTFQSINILGETQALGTSALGINAGGNYLAFNEVSVGGYYSNAAYQIQCGGYMEFRNCCGSNSGSGGSTVVCNWLGSSQGKVSIINSPTLGLPS